MSNELNERKIIEALSGVRMPESDDAITDAGNVSGIVIKDGHVSFTTVSYTHLTLPTKA